MESVLLSIQLYDHCTAANLWPLAGLRRDAFQSFHHQSVGLAYHKLHLLEVLAFWLAHLLTRPLAASLCDLLT
jgi:hypothetical protein